MPKKYKTTTDTYRKRSAAYSATSNVKGNKVVKGYTKSGVPITTTAKKAGKPSGRKTNKDAMYSATSPYKPWPKLK